MWDDPFDAGPPTDLDDDVSVVVHCTDWETVEAVADWLRKGKHEFRSVILDSITELQKQCKRAIMEIEGMRIQDWGTLYERMDPVLREIRDLTKHPKNPVDLVVITALSTVKGENEKARTIPDIQGSMARSLAGQMDTIGYLRTGDLNASGQFDRELLVDPRGGVYAGDRTKVLRRTFKGVIPIVLDDETDEMEWSLEDLLDGMNDGF